jgi:hypothetical protein
VIVRVLGKVSITGGLRKGGAWDGGRPGGGGGSTGSKLGGRGTTDQVGKDNQGQGWRWGNHDKNRVGHGRGAGGVQ